jgi:hypothetical protein
MLATALRRHDVRRDDPPRFLVHGAVRAAVGLDARCAGSAACPRRPATPSACSPRITWC